MALSEDERQKIDDIAEKVGETNTAVAVLVERSTNQEKRLDGIDKRTGLIAALTGGGAGAIGVFVRSFFTGD